MIVAFIPSQLVLIFQSAFDTKIAVPNQKHLAITFLLFAAFLY